MNTHLDFFSARAAEAMRDADAAVLDNVRERCLRAAAAWNAMAERADRLEKLRDETEAAKAARKAD